MDRANQPLGRSSRIHGLKLVSGVSLFLALFYVPTQRLAASLPAQYSVTLAWDANTSDQVVGYNLYSGGASRNYNTSQSVGNVTTNTVSGLTAGVPYFFAVTAYDINGQESDFSSEISFVPGPNVQLQVGANQQMILNVTGQIGGNYDVQASQTLTNWTVIGNVTLGASGSLAFTDTNAANFPKRFYRTQQKL